MSSYYELLGVDKGASFKQIRGGYRRQAMKWHPDRNPTNRVKAGERFKEIANAYRVLSDEVQRAEYDSWLGAQESSRAGASASGANTSGPSDAGTQLFFEQMLDLAHELAKNGVDTAAIVDALTALDCPESIARAVAASALRAAHRRTEASLNPEPTSPATDESGNLDGVGFWRGFAALVGLPVMAVSAVIAVGFAVGLYSERKADPKTLSQVAEGVALLSSAKAAATQFITEYQAIPQSLKQLGIAPDLPIIVKSFEALSSGGLRLQFGSSATQQIAGKFLWLVAYGSGINLMWACGSADIPIRYLPNSCNVTQFPGPIAYDFARRQKWSNTTNAEELKKIDLVLENIERSFPVLDYRSRNYSEKIIDDILRKQVILIKDGLPPSSALMKAVSDMEREGLLVRKR